MGLVTNKYLVLSFWWLPLLVMGCTTSRLNVQTTPAEAEVYVVYPGQQPALLGKSPLDIPGQGMFSHQGTSFKLIVKKEGFFSEQFLVPKSIFTSIKSNVKLDVAMIENKAPTACTEQDAAVEEVARSVAQAQSFIQAKRYDSANRILLNLSDRYPNSSVVYDLLGNTYYLMKDLETALNFYEKSLRLSPNNSETQRMVNKLKSIYSIRAPAGK